MSHGGCRETVCPSCRGRSLHRERQAEAPALPNHEKAQEPVTPRPVTPGNDKIDCRRSVRPGLRAVLLIFVPFAAAGLFGCAVTYAADNSGVEPRIKAAFIYNFARFIEWPAGSAQRPMRIGIQGRGDLATPLEAVIRGKTANGRPLEIVPVSTASEAEHCEILLIERSEASRVREIVRSLAGKPVLTVCDGNNCLRDGAMIAFRIVDDSVRFEINQEAAEHAGLKISSQLLKVAIPAGRRP